MLWQIGRRMTPEWEMSKGIWNQIQSNVCNGSYTYSLVPTFVECFFFANILVTKCLSHTVLWFSALNSESKLWHLICLHLITFLVTLMFHFVLSLEMSGVFGLYIGHNQKENMQSLRIQGLDILHWVQWSSSRWVLSGCNKEKSIIPTSHNFHTMLICKVAWQFVQ